MTIRLDSRRLAILADREKPEYKRILDECKRLGDFLLDKNVEYWSGGTGASKLEMRQMMEDFNNAGLRPTVCFPSLPSHAESAKVADCLFRPYLINTSGIIGHLANFSVFLGRQKSNKILSERGYPEGMEIRDSVYLVLDGSTSVGRHTGAKTILDDKKAARLFEKGLAKHSNVHGYVEGGSETVKSPVYKRISLIESADSMLPSDKILHVGGSISGAYQIESMDDKIRRKNVVYVVGNHFERNPEDIKEFASLFPK